MLIKHIRATKIKDFFNSWLQVYTVIASRWVLLHVSSTEEVQTNGESKGQGRKGNKDLFWTLLALSFTVSNKPLEAIFKVPTTAL